MKIFLSHRSRDKALVREFKSALPGFLGTWLDEESLRWGDDFPIKLKTTIQSEVDFLIIFLDRDALRSAWVVRELEWALERERELRRTFVLPILIEAVPCENLPAGFAERIYLQLSDFNRTSVEELARKATEKLFQLVVESRKITGDWLAKFSAIGVNPLKMYGFGDHPAESVFRDPECIRAMWADPRGNDIRARFDADGYTIRFHNTCPGAYPSDVTFRPSGHQALSTRRADGPGCHHSLSIRLHSPEKHSPSPVAVGFRLIDRLGTQWSYAKGPDYHLVETIPPGGTADAVLKLDEAHRWRLFEPDGNWVYHAPCPDFSVIAAIVFELGGPYGNQRPGVGGGTVVIRDIRLGDAP